MPVERFLARQPIFDTALRVVAYELLFRSDLDNYCKAVDTTQASSSVISHSALLFDLPHLTGGHRAFVNIGREGLLADHVRVLPPAMTTVEILEHVVADDAVVDACLALKADGYRIALDDYVEGPDSAPLLALADCIKVDVLATPPDRVAELAARLARPGLQLLAEKVETQAVFDEAAKLGFTLFQGYFFARPTVLSGQDVPGFKLAYLQLLQEINRDPFELDRVERIIRQDVSMSYKFLRYINSAAVGLRGRVTSIREAMVLLGQRRIRALGSVWALSGLGQDKPEELVTASVLRAGFCERLAPLAGLRGREDEAFLLGMLSLIDVLVGRPMEDVVGELPLSEDARTALVKGVGPLDPLLRSAIAYEHGEWQAVSRLAAEVGVEESVVPQLYLDAIPAESPQAGAPA
jgi:EAL and modified HD-GYP domain-containing signal transduction protein